ncbi:MAG TPA: AbrB/MazE/SpoVT family DNA-binding domain-containing protein [Methylomirabilota bacterium]|nr:AbrB/MazE/SpoVT family DNA-binding domain-containing protein [Methylomirabilota bacterium]
MKSTVSSKGQITLPAPIREKLGLGPGTAVRFEVREGGVFLRKGASGTHPVDQLFGRLKLRKSVDSLLDEMREPRPRPSTGAVRQRTRKR